MHPKCHRLWILLVVLLALSLLPGPVLAEECNEIQEGQTLTVNITEEGRTLRYRFVPEETAIFVFRAESDDDTYGSILDSHGNELVAGNDGNDRDFLIQVQLQAGETYFLEARYLHSSDTGTLSVTLERLESTPIRSHQTLTADITRPGQVARFCFVPEETGVYLFRGESEADTYGTLLDDQGNQLVLNYDNNGRGFQLQTEFLAGKSYILEAQYHDSDATGSFSVTLEPLQSVPVAAGQTLTVDISQPGQMAWFRFVPEHTTVYIFRSESDGDTYGTLMDGRCNRLAWSDDHNGRDFEIRSELQAGETYFWVAQYHSLHDTGTFSVSLEITHNYRYSIHTPATCTESGTMEYRCVICGDSYIAQIPPIHDGDDCGGCEATAVSQGLCGDAVYWYLTDDGCLTLKGSGETWDFAGFETEHITYVYPSEYDPVPWKDYCQQITSIRIDPEITYLGECIFWAHSQVEELILPEGLTEMGCHWLDHCSSLQRLHIPSTMTFLAGFELPQEIPRQLSFAGAAPSLYYGYLLLGDTTELVILYHSSCPGWEEAMADWEVPVGTRWLDLDGAIAPPEFAIDQRGYTLSPGRSIRLSTNADPYTDYLLTQWDTDFPEILVVTNGTVTGLRPGTATVTVSSADGVYSSSCQVTVTESGLPDSRQSSLEGSFCGNAGDHSYYKWDTCGDSFLVEREDGTLEVVQYIQDTGVVIQRYDQDLVPVFQRVIQPEMPIFGGFYAGEEYYYLLYGQENPEEIDSNAVMAIVRYTKNWRRLDQCFVRGANTTIPFDSGTADFTEAGGKLYLHTCRQMYRAGGGHHQSNMTFEIDFDVLFAEEIFYGYASHSFSQRVRATGDALYRVDHGDAYPRAVYLTRMAIGDSLAISKGRNLLEIQGSIGANTTGVTLGGMELSAANCLVVGSSVDQSTPEAYDTDDMENIFLAVADQDLDASRLIWLTEHPGDGSYGATTPQLVKIAEDLFLVMWEELEYTPSWDSSFVCTRALLIDGAGNHLSRVVSLAVRLSDCQPIVTEKGLVTWFVVEDSGEQGLLPRLYQLSWYQLLTDPDSVEAALGHNYTAAVTAPTCTEGGYTTYTCACGDSYTAEETAALGHDFVNGSCTRCDGADPDYVPENPFTDVPEEQWYFEPVLWAVENGITSGTSATTFSPDNTCTRAQVVTFLWRAFGQPEPTQTENPFTDVAEGDYYYNAVLWAVEEGITAGMTPTTFVPNNPCTRGQVVTFLWRAMDKPIPENAENPFTDVSDSEWFFTPVLWAVENGITAGMNPSTFAPTNFCIRAQVVTFLYRALAEEL